MPGIVDGAGVLRDLRLITDERLTGAKPQRSEIDLVNADTRWQDFNKIVIAGIRQCPDIDRDAGQHSGLFDHHGLHGQRRIQVAGNRSRCNFRQQGQIQIGITGGLKPDLPTTVTPGVIKQPLQLVLIDGEPVATRKIIIE